MAKRKVVSHAARLQREALAANLTAEVRRQYPNIALSTAFVRITRATGVSLSTLQRITSGNAAPQTDTLADLAHHLGTTVQALTAQRDPPGRLRAVQ